MLALNKVKSIFSTMDYQIVKSQIIPRVLQILETAKDIDLKLEVLDTVRLIIKGIDAQTLKTDVVKSLEKLRINDNNPKVCLKMLQVYEEIGKILGPEEVGQKILPGIIPMLVTGQFTQDEFKNLMNTVRSLLDQIEKYRLPGLPAGPGATSSGNSDIFSGVGSKSEAKDNEFGFLSGEPTSSVAATESKQNDPFGANSDPFSTASLSNDIFSGISNSKPAAK